MNAKTMIHADQQLVIIIEETSTQADLRAKTIELGAPIGKTSLSNLLNGKVEQTGGWMLGTAANTTDTADSTKPLEGELLLANESPADVAPAAPAAASDTANTMLDDIKETAAPAAAPAAVAPVEETAKETPAAKPAAAPKTGVPRYERDASIKALTDLVDYEPILKEAPTETYVTLKLKKARIQATVGVRGVTLMLFPLKGLVLQEIDPAKTGWVVKAQYAKVGVFAPDAVAAALVMIEAEIAKLA